MDHGHCLHLLGGSISHCLLLYVLLRCIAVGDHVRLLLLRIRLLLLLLLLFLHGTYDYLLLLATLVVIPPSIGLLLHLLRLLLCPAELAGRQLLLLRILLLLLWWLWLLVLLLHGSCYGLEVWAWRELTLVTDKCRHHLWLDLMLLLMLLLLLVLNNDGRLLIAHIQVVLEHGLLEAKIATTDRSALHILAIC